MASVGHLAVGLLAGRLSSWPRRRWMWTSVLVLLAYLPDADVIAFLVGIPYAAPWGHRGAAHSLMFAAACGAAMAAAARMLRLPALQVGIASGLVVASHGLLDTLTDGGLGIALLWPFDDERYFAPWQPIPVAPIGARILSERGLRLMAYEVVLFLPLFIAAFWPRAKGRAGRAL